MWRGRGCVLLLALALALAVLPTHGYEADVLPRSRRPTLEDYLRSSSAGLDEAQCLARIDDLKASPYALLEGAPDLFYADIQVRDAHASPVHDVSLEPPQVTSTG